MRASRGFGIQARTSRPLHAFEQAVASVANRAAGQPAGGLVVVQGDAVLGKPGATMAAVHARRLRPGPGMGRTGDVVGGDLPLAGRDEGPGCIAVSARWLPLPQAVPRGQG